MVVEEVGEVRVGRHDVAEVAEKLALRIVDGPYPSTLVLEHLKEPACRPAQLPLLQSLHGGGLAA